MIQSLHIQGLAIIDELNIDFNSGFNVITGETGAGKSILIRALSFLLGHKVGVDVIRRGFEHASVTGEFLLRSGHEVLSFLEERGIPLEKDAEGALVIVRRQMNQKGRSSAWINDVPVTGQTLKEMGLGLVDIFGQHDNQKLMRPEFHLSYLDRFLEDQDVLIRFQEQYKICSGLFRRVSDVLEKCGEGRKDLDYQIFRLQELQEFEPGHEDFSRISDLIENSKHSLLLKESLSSILDGFDTEASPVNRSVWDVAKKLGRLAEKVSIQELEPLRAQAETVASELDALSFGLNRLLNQVDVDESAVESAQKRLFGYQELFRKHGVRDIEQLLVEYSHLKQTCVSKEEMALQLLGTLKELSQEAQKLQNMARELSTLRKKAGHRIKKSVEAELAELAMPGAVFDVAWEDTEAKTWMLDCTFFEDETLEQLSKNIAERLEMIGAAGYESAEFLLASNPGEPVLPLMKVASGGELSRIMLALKKALVVDADTCVLVFDEIDTGISGRVADVVGKKMRGLAETFQVVCISHLPQVAVYADTHFLVKKQAKKRSSQDATERTESTLVKLTREESTAEIARLLSGSEVSKAGLANAQALMEKARKMSKSPASAGKRARI
ncbi:DNA repair protein RecN [bacterium]|nr:DNA repair protein RecN [bacterium]NBX83187.1 DNA repair protein RecN [bacterium]